MVLSLEPRRRRNTPTLHTYYHTNRHRRGEREKERENKREKLSWRRNGFHHSTKATKPRITESEMKRSEDLQRIRDRTRMIQR